MTEPPLTRQIAHYRLHELQDTLLTTIAGLSEPDLLAIRVTPEWNGLDILRHLSVWGDLTARTLANWGGQQNWVLESVIFDDFNAEMVAERADKPLQEIIARIIAAHQQYTKTLLDSTDDELLERAVAPWNQELNQLQMIYGIVGHDLNHLKELQQAREQARVAEEKADE